MPNQTIYVFIEMLQKDQATNEAKIIQINAGGVRKPRRDMWILKK